MQTRTPFLFSMPPLFAWPLAAMTSIVLVLALNLIFVEPPAEGESGAEAPAEAAAPGETSDEAAEEAAAASPTLSSTGQTLLLGLLILSVGLIPMMARRKRVKVLWWSAGGVVAGFLYLFTGGLPLIHPLMVLLALVYLRAQPQAAPVPAPDMRASETRQAAPVDAPPQQGAAPPARRRPLRRRRRRF